jgi:hypothetical protein
MLPILSMMKWDCCLQRIAARLRELADKARQGL